MPALLLLMAVLAAAEPTAVAPDTVVLTVHGRQYTRAEFEAIAREQNAAASSDAIDRLAAAADFARVQALADEARRRRLDQSPTVRAKLAIYTGGLLQQALFDDILAEIHRDESLARRRFESRQHFAEERRLRQILIRHADSKPVAGKPSSASALQQTERLRARIAAGESFAELAEEHSDDERTKAQGGDMGFVRKPLLATEFGEAAFRLKVGEVSQPVETTNGYHLILLEEIAPPPFESVRKSIEFELARERLEAMVVEGIELNPDYFGQ